MGFNCKFCRCINQVDTKLFLTICLQLLVNVLLSLVMSKSRSFTRFNASVAHFLNPWLLRFFNSQYTFFTNLSSDIWWSRFMKHKVDKWSRFMNIKLICGTRYSGVAYRTPHSNHITSCGLDTQYTSGILQEDFISIAPKLGIIPQTSLSYIKIGFINVSKRLSIKSGESSPIAFILVFILNMAFLAWSHKNWYVFFSASWLGNFIELMMLPRYL